MLHWRLSFRQGHLPLSIVFHQWPSFNFVTFSIKYCIPFKGFFHIKALKHMTIQWINQSGAELSSNLNGKWILLNSRFVGWTKKYWLLWLPSTTTLHWAWVSDSSSSKRHGLRHVRLTWHSGRKRFWRVVPTYRKCAVIFKRSFGGYLDVINSLKNQLFIPRQVDLFLETIDLYEDIKLNFFKLDNECWRPPVMIFCINGYD